MVTVKVSSKRQVTFPKRVCESLGIQTGDEILLDRHVESGREVWYLVPAKAQGRSWLGALKDYSAGKNHEMEAVRESVAKGRVADRS